MLRIYSFLSKFRVGLEGESFALTQIYNSHALILNSLSIEQNRRLKTSTAASSLFVQELNEDSVGKVINVNRLTEDGKEQAMHLTSEQLPLVIEKYDRVSEAYLKAGSTTDPVEALIFNFLRLSLKSNYDVLIFSNLVNQDYE